MFHKNKLFNKNNSMISENSIILQKFLQNTYVLHIYPFTIKYRERNIKIKIKIELNILILSHTCINYFNKALYTLLSIMISSFFSSLILLYSFLFFSSNILNICSSEVCLIEYSVT